MEQSQHRTFSIMQSNGWHHRRAKRCAPHQRRLHCFWQSNEDNDKALENLLRRFPECGLTFNPEKCIFRLPQNSSVSSSRKMELSYHWPNFAERTTPYATSPIKELNGDGHKPREQHSKNSRTHYQVTLIEIIWNWSEYEASGRCRTKWPRVGSHAEETLRMENRRVS